MAGAKNSFWGGQEGEVHEGCGLLPAFEFLAGLEDLEAGELLEMLVVGENSGTDFLGAGGNEDVLGWKRDA